MSSAHLARMKASAETLGYAFDRHAARNELQAATFRLRGPSRVRLVLARSGAIAIEVAAAPEPVAGPVAVAIVPLPVDARRLAAVAQDQRPALLRRSAYRRRGPSKWRS